jgi:hypothetical protein
MNPDIQYCDRCDNERCLYCDECTICRECKCEEVQYDDTETSVCERCNAEYPKQEYERMCEECRFVHCTGCGDWAIRYEVCSHGVDGWNNCDCVCLECKSGKTDDKEDTK